MRGKLPASRLNGRNVRITPADAGKTKGEDAGNCLREDHPRGCGENLLTETNTDRQKGSPPRMRGKLRKMHEKFGQDRITPADAGKTTV